MTDKINKAERTYGASFRRDLDCWVVYAWLGEEELCRCSHDKIDDLLAALSPPPVRFTREDVEKAARKIERVIHRRGGMRLKACATETAAEAATAALRAIGEVEHG